MDTVSGRMMVNIDIYIMMLPIEVDMKSLRNSISMNLLYLHDPCCRPYCPYYPYSSWIIT